MSGQPSATPVPMDRLTVRHESLDVETIMREWRSGKVSINEEYQRSEVWPEAKKRLLIDSLLKGYSISTFIYRDLRGGSYEVLDGQQRLRSLDQFTSNQFEFRTEDPSLAHLDGLLFNAFPESIKYSKLLARHVNLVHITSDDEAVITEIFLRLQEGMPLNNAEKLHATRGKMRDAVLGLSREPFLGHTSVSAFRFNHRYVMAQALALEIRGLQQHHFSQVSFRLLRSLHQQFQNVDVPAGDVKRVRAALRYLDQTVKNNAKIIATNPDLLTLISVTSYFLEHYAIRDVSPASDDFVLDFLSKVETPTQEPYLTYATYRSMATLSRESIQKRFDSISSAILEFYPGMVALDPQRQFDRGMKLAVYRRAGGKCEECGTQLSFDRAEADHAFAWSRGGATTLENAQLLCVPCNRSKGAR